jgi:hypothetical protein
MMAAADHTKMARQDLTVKMGSDVVRKAKVVALNRNITLAEYLTERIRPLVDADYEQEVAKMSKEVKGTKGGAK